MAAQYTVLIPPTRVTADEAEFINTYRRENRVTISETLRRCVKALQANGREFTQMFYGSSKQQLPGFLVDEDTYNFIVQLAYEKDTSRCQIIRAAIDCMSKQEVKVK